MSMDEFWAAIDSQLDMLKTAANADDVIRILGGRQVTVSSGDAFFGGSGGDGSVFGSLAYAGWQTIWHKASYYWAMKAPDGSAVTYIEGDIYRGVQPPI